MNTLITIKETLQKHKDDIYNKYSVKSFGIFGSYARNEQTKTSDIDILVEFDKPIGLEFVALAEYLESLLGIKVDLVSKKSIKPKLMEYIQRDIHYV